MSRGRGLCPALIVAAAALAGGCDREASHPQQWWDAHRDQAEQKLMECNSMAEAERLARTDCARALAAMTNGANAGTEVLPPAESWVKQNESDE